jgi:nucleoside 2-deoxyribosyltransferase
VGALAAREVKPTVFIGSSGESLPIVRTLFRLLEDSCTVLPWNADIFTPGAIGLQSLISRVAQVDFAVFVFAGDDLTVSRGVEKSSPRDNVTFELGLFMGQLGHERTLIVYDSDDSPKLPTDLLGVTVLRYRPTDNLMASLTGVANELTQHTAALGIRKDRLKRLPIAYWCGPHANPDNYSAARVLEHHGITVKMPKDLFSRRGTPRRQTEIRDICCQAIKDSDIVVVDLDSYGLDSAWEMGYAEALGIPVVGVSRSPDAMQNPRLVNKRLHRDNSMHGWDGKFVSTDLGALTEKCLGKVVYLFCPYKNEVAMERIRDSELNRKAERVIFSMDILGVDPKNPLTYTWRARQQSVKFIEECDIVLTVLPRYGMDSAWKLGYAEAFQKETVGWITDDFGSPASESIFLDHWMHGWKQKTWVTDLRDLAMLIRGNSEISSGG